MSDGYTVFLKERVHQVILRMPKDPRRSINAYLAQLAVNPFDEGDFSESDANGRTTHCKVIRHWALTFYPDHAVKEIKVVEIVETP